MAIGLKPQYIVGVTELEWPPSCFIRPAKPAHLRAQGTARPVKAVKIDEAAVA
jgi:hypothetical protein